MSISDEDLRAFAEEYEAKHPGFLSLPCEEAAAFLKADLEDQQAKLDQEQRENGEMPRSDAKLFMSVARGYREDVRMADVMEILRMKKRRGHKQQRALDLWDQYYKSGRISEIFVPDEPGMGEEEEEGAGWGARAGEA